MSRMDGLEATRLIREWEVANNRHHVKIVAMTAGVMDEDRVACRRVGMQLFLANQSVSDRWMRCYGWHYPPRIHQSIQIVELAASAD